MAQMIDLTLPWSVETPSWPYFPNPQAEAFHRHPREGLNSLIVKTAMHTGTHLDAPLHLDPGGWDLARIPLEMLWGPAVAVDVSQDVGVHGVITPEIVQRRLPEPLRPGDRLLVHTGWHRYAWCGPEANETTYFAAHPGPSHALVDWLLEQGVEWIGVDTPAWEHPLNTAIRDMRPDQVAEFERVHGRSLESEYPREKLLYSHKRVAAKNKLLVECLGEGLAEVTGRRFVAGAFPWRFVRGEASICRVVAWID
ncbi:MAG: cyclase family protein [Firmicutes bacterium]|nr:cyclase family protein [Bacillota bacterium]